MAGRKVQKPRQIDIKRASTEALKRYIANEGKRLNQQIAQIEKRPDYVKASFAYKKLTESPATAQYLGVNKSGRTKIELNTRGKSHQQLQELANLIRKYSGAQTMTVQGIKQYYGKVFCTLRAKYPGLNKFSDEQLADILTTEGFESSKGADGSDRIFKLISESNDVDSIVEYIEKRSGFETIMQANNEWESINGRPIPFALD